MTITRVTLTMSVLLFSQVFGNFDGRRNNDFFDNNGFDNNGFDNNGFDNNGFDNNYFDNGFDDNGLFVDRNGVEGGILGSSGVIGGGVSGSHHGGQHSYMPPPPQPRFDSRIGGAALGGSFNPISTRPMMFPRKIQMPMPLPPIGGGIGGVPRYPKFGRGSGGILGGRRPMFPRRRALSPIGGSMSRGFGKHFRFGMIGRGGVAGLSRRRFKTY